MISRMASDDDYSNISSEISLSLSKSTLTEALNDNYKGFMTSSNSATDDSAVQIHNPNVRSALLNPSFLRYILYNIN